MSESNDARGDAGGAAASGGVEFQQRLGAYFAVAMLRRFDLAPVLELAVPTILSRVSFETGAAVDDLTLWTDRPAVYVQAKRSISLSASAESAFASAVQQFVAQWRGDASACCVLATGPRASRRITQELRKILISLRQNPAGGDPLTKSEQEVLSTFRSVADDAHKSATGTPFGEEDFKRFASVVRVVPFDIESAGADERTAIALLSAVPGIKIAPALLWSHIVLIALRSATSRSTIAREPLEGMVAKWVDLGPDDPALEEDRFFSIEEPARILSGVDALLAMPGKRNPLPIESDAMVLMDLYRFDDNGARRSRFTATECVTKNGFVWEVLVRGATMKAVERYLDEHAELRERKLLVFNTNFSSNPNDHPPALAHEASLKRTLRRPALLHCVRCGLNVGEASPSFVEADEDGEPSIVGVVHKECLRPCNRILGQLRVPLYSEHTRLGSFDFEAYAQALRTGAGLVRSKLVLPPEAVIGWHPETRRDAGRTRAVRLLLADGSAVPVTHRMQVQRFTCDEAQKSIMEFQASILAAIGREDPLAIAVESGTFSTYSRLLSLAKGETIVLIDGAEEVDCTAGLVQAYSTVENYYAPLLVLRVGPARETFKIGGSTVFLSDPLAFDRFVSNWQDGGLDVGDFSVDLVKDDAAFDSMMREAVGAGTGGLLDPLVNLKGEPVAGHRIAQSPAWDPCYI